jgi:DNA-binding NarL/FixJ family response regulator
LQAKRAMTSNCSEFCLAFKLTPRQTSVFSMLVAGFAPKEIADRHSLSHVTVRRHSEEICRRCGVRNQRELLALFARSVMAAADAGP